MTWLKLLQHGLVALTNLGRQKRIPFPMMCLENRIPIRALQLSSGPKEDHAWPEMLRSLRHASAFRSLLPPPHMLNVVCVVLQVKKDLQTHVALPAPHSGGSSEPRTTEPK